MVGSAASGTPSLSLSVAVLPVAARTPNWRTVTPLVLARRSMAVALPAIVSVVEKPAAMVLTFSIRLSEPDASRIAVAEPLVPVMLAVMSPELPR